MKKLIKLFLLCLITFCVIGCANPANNSNGDDEKKPVDTTELKMALYNKILGTWELEEGDQSDSGYETIVFSSDSITFNGEKKSFEPNKNLFFADEVPEEKNLRGYGTIYIDVDGLTAIVFDTSLSKVDSLELGKVFYSEISNRWTALPDDFVRVSGGSSDSGSGEGLDFSVVGDWSYSIQGFQPTTLTLYNDQTFEFNKNNDITSGTYSLSGNKITFDFEKGGQEITDMFIISGSENEITLNLVKSITTYDGSTQESTTMSYMLLAFYTTMETSITLTK